MLNAAVPEIHVTSARAAREFYGAALGFTCQSAWRPDNAREDPCYMTFTRDGARLNVSSFKDGAIGIAVYVYVDDVDSLYQEFVEKGLRLSSPPIDQSWGTREFGVRDADGNSIRFGQTADTRDERAD